MNEITRITLDNEMDMILAHKQSMRLAELLGLSLATQTTFATAVSEICRVVMGRGIDASLSLQIMPHRTKGTFLRAFLQADGAADSAQLREGVRFARKLIHALHYSDKEGVIKVDMELLLPSVLKVTPALMDNWRIILNNDPSISPYEEIKRKNRQLEALAAELRQSERQYKMLADSLPIMIYTFSTEGKLLYANEWLLQYTGLSVEELNESKFRNVYHPDDFSAIWESWNEDHKDRLIKKERKLRGSDGTYRWHTGISIPVRNDDGEVLYWNAFMVDIHAQKIIEETLKDNIELKETKKELEEKVDLLDRSNKLLEQFAFVTSHDLQEPLRKINFFSNYLKSNFGTSMGENGNKYLDKLVNETNRTRDIVRDILHYSTINKERERFELLDLNEIVGTVISDMEMLLAEKDAVVDFAALPSVSGTKIQVTQLFLNLLSNALKFVPADRRPHIRIFASQKSGQLCIHVEDNGIGIEEQYFQKIFGLFQRLHSKDEFSGTGIGLSTCKKIMEFHDGTIEVKSKIDEGSTFTLCFPSA